MSYQPTDAELAQHTFAYDGKAIDKDLADFLQKFYTLSDDREHADSWAACFAVDSTMKRKTADAQGRDGKPELHVVRERWLRKYSSVEMKLTEKMQQSLRLIDNRGKARPHVCTSCTRCSPLARGLPRKSCCTG